MSQEQRQKKSNKTKGGEGGRGNRSRIVGISKRQAGATVGQAQCHGVSIGATLASKGGDKTRRGAIL